MKLAGVSPGTLPTAEVVVKTAEAFAQVYGDGVIPNTNLCNWIADNVAAGSSGAIGAGGDVTLINSTLVGNSAGANGGAVRVGSNGSLLAINTTLTGNTSGSSGGAISVGVAGQLEVHSSTISGNQAVQGGGISVYGRNLTVTNSTISGNQAVLRGGGIFNGRQIGSPGGSIDRWRRNGSRPASATRRSSA